MKKFLNVLLFLLFIQNVQAMCKDTDISFWPKNGMLKSGQAIIIFGYGTTQEFIDSIGTKYNVYLKSGSEKIKLKVKELHKSGYNETQVILFPETALKIGDEYLLVYDPLKEDIDFKIWDWKSKKSIAIQWEVIGADKSTKSIWTKNPTKQSMDYFELGCGPLIYVHFNLGITDSSEILIRATVIDKLTKQETVYIQTTHGAKAAIGHGMCSGEFNIKKGDNYLVKFEWLDMYNLSVIATSKQIEFTALEEESKENSLPSNH